MEKIPMIAIPITTPTNCLFKEMSELTIEMTYELINVKISTTAIKKIS